MATLRDIRRRIASVQNTRKITKAMEMVSAAKLRREQQRIEALRPYAIDMVRDDDRPGHVLGRGAAATRCSSSDRRSARSPWSS